MRKITIEMVDGGPCLFSGDRGIELPTPEDVEIAEEILAALYPSREVAGCRHEVVRCLICGTEGSAWQVSGSIPKTMTDEEREQRRQAASRPRPNAKGKAKPKRKREASPE